MALTVKNMSIFDAPPRSVIIHASNATTGWGAGIAKEFKRLYPRADQSYRDIIKQYNVLGKFLIFPCHDDGPNMHQIATLVTSKDKGSKVDSPEVILKNTEDALKDMMTFSVFKHGFIKIVYSNKFNSGLFNVPWEDTEKILKEFADKNNIEWIVCEQ